MQQEIHPIYHKVFLHKKQQGTWPHQACGSNYGLQEIQGLEEYVNATMHMQPAKPQMWEIPEDTWPSFFNQ